MNKLYTFLFLSLIIFFGSCTNNEMRTFKDVKPESIYFDYRVWGDEESGDITVKLQYRFAGHNGATLLLEDPSKAELDGVPIKADSSKKNGVYYEVTKPVKGFAGKHTIVFTDINGKKYQEEFNFKPIIMKTNVPAVVKRGDLVFDLDGLAPQDYVYVMLSDTVSFSEGISRIDTVRNGRIVISKADLGAVANGPVRLEISKEDEKWIKNRTKEGGKLTISYELKREFELKK